MAIDGDGAPDEPDSASALSDGDEEGHGLAETTETTEEVESNRVKVGEYDWDDFRDEYEDEESDEPFDPESYLGFDPDEIETVIGSAGSAADIVSDVFEERTVRVNPALDEDEFFSTSEGITTLVNRYDLERAVPQEKKSHFREIDRYWVNDPYAFVIIFHSEKENEKKYYVVQPYLTPIEARLREFLQGKLKTAIKYADDDVTIGGDTDVRGAVIDRETHNLLDRYDLFDGGDEPGYHVTDMVKQALGFTTGEDESTPGLDGIAARPEPALIDEDAETLTEYQVEKLLYVLKRDFVGYERIDPIKHDINVEDISCDGYDSPVFVYHSEYEQIISNVHHGQEELDDFVVKLAQRSGKGISKRQPQVDATLPDGSRAQLTLGKEVSDHGTNYTIRQFKDVPFTPVDLINWNTFSMTEMAFLWLCIENNKSLIFAGGTASGKTTSLNAVSLFIPSKAKIVSIEDTREVELPQRNWIASVTRPSFSGDDRGDVDEFDLLEAALRQRPEYIVMGEIRGEEGRTAFQVMSTGHTTLTTFHADSVGEVIKRFTTDPINVSKTMFTALDLVSIQTQTRVDGTKVRRTKALTEINHYDPENDEINVQDIYQWQAETDEYLKLGDSNVLEEIRFDRGWSTSELEEAVFAREIVLSYLIERGLNTYTQVAATLQAFINDPETILTLIANDQLERSLEDLREMESVEIDIDPEMEAMVPRPSPGEEELREVRAKLDDAKDLLDRYRGESSDDDLMDLLDIEEEPDIEVGTSDQPGSFETTADGGEGSPNPFETDDRDSVADSDAGSLFDVSEADADDRGGGRIGDDGDAVGVGDEEIRDSEGDTDINPQADNEDSNEDIPQPGRYREDGRADDVVEDDDIGWKPDGTTGRKNDDTDVTDDTGADESDFASEYRDSDDGT
ncbi:MAG: type II/IV secretion system ATPase subunit [Natronomonas sp.]